MEYHLERILRTALRVESYLYYHMYCSTTTSYYSSGTGVSGTGVGNIKTQDVTVPVQKEPYCSYSSTKYVTVCHTPKEVTSDKST